MFPDRLMHSLSTMLYKSEVEYAAISINPRYSLVSAPSFPCKWQCVTLLLLLCKHIFFCINVYFPEATRKYT